MKITTENLVSKVKTDEAMFEKVYWFNNIFDEDGNFVDMEPHVLGGIGLVDGIDGWVAVDYWQNPVGIFQDWDVAYETLKEPYL